MNKTIIKKDVGFLVIDDHPDGSSEVYLEEDFGVNCYGDVGCFYRDSSEDIPNGGICYAEEVNGGVLSFNDPDFNKHAYTYDDVVQLCKGIADAAKYCLEVADGCGLLSIWEAIEPEYIQGN